MNIPKVSVTVPIYNTSKYLSKCLESLVAQTLQDIEFILVDDGSTDNSGLICEEYAKKDSRFKVIHQQNRGSAMARQAGLDASEGEYVIVCDSDDWVDSDMYEKLYYAAKESEADMVMCGYFCEYPDGKSIPVQKWFSDLSFEEHVKDLMFSSYNATWIRLIKRKTIVDNNIKYEPDINLGEDFFILYKLMLTHPKLEQIDAKLYHYRKVLGGSSYTNNVKMAQIIKSRKALDWVEKNYDNEIFAECIYNMNVRFIFNGLRAKDPDLKYLGYYLKTKIKWNLFFKYKKTLKILVVYAAKIIPPKYISYLIKKMYKFVY